MLLHSINNVPTLRVFMGSPGRQDRPVAHLRCLQSQENYTWLIWKSGERTLMPRTLKYLEACLPPGQFVRLRRQYTVNVDQIVEVDHPRFDRMTVWLQTGEQIEVSRRRIATVRRVLVP